MKKEIIETTPQGTRDAILRESLRLINDQGMIDFRIDALATSLALSPGNITYHFSRKEDICSTLWETYIEEYSKVVVTLTSLLDLKQVFLMNRANMLLAYKFRGVVTFRSADFGAMCRDEQTNHVNYESHRDISKKLYKLLISNGYMIPHKGNEESYTIATTNHYLVMRWAINLAFQQHTEADIGMFLDKYALLCLHTNFPLLTAKGIAEFMEIADKVKTNSI